MVVLASTKESSPKDKRKIFSGITIQPFTDRMLPSRMFWMSKAAFTKLARTIEHCGGCVDAVFKSEPKTGATSTKAEDRATKLLLIFVEGKSWMK